MALTRSLNCHLDDEDGVVVLDTGHERRLEVQEHWEGPREVSGDARCNVSRHPKDTRLRLRTRTPRPSLSDVLLHGIRTGGNNDAAKTAI